MQPPIFIHHHHDLIAYTIHSWDNHTTKISKRQQQRQAVRKLLQIYLANHPNLNLQDNQYPYTLVDNQGWVEFFVSFSHSNNYVCLIISPNPCGIDIELSAISPSVAQRFFHPNELLFIQNLNMTDQAQARLRLWQIKESYAKASVSTLSQTLSCDFSDILPTVLYHQPISSDNSHAIRQIYQGEHWLALTLQS